MGEEISKGRIYSAITVVEFIIAVSTFLSTWILYSYRPEISFLIGVAVLVLLFLITETASRFTLHSRYLAPLRKRLLYWLSGVNIRIWHVILEIDEDGTAAVTNDFSGEINFGTAQWITLGIWTGQDQLKDEKFKVRIFDVGRQTEQEPELVLNESRYKKVRIRFADVLKRGDKFHLRVQYKLEKTFYFDKEDYYDFEAVHHEREVHMRIIFPENIKVEYTRGEIVTEHGDVWEEVEKPKIVESQTIEWRVHQALHGNHHRCYWKARKKT